MMSRAKRDCPICGNIDIEPLHSQRFVLPVGHPLSGGYDVVYCTSCGFVYADVEVDQTAYDRFYAEFSKYEDNSTSTGGGGSVYDLERLKKTAVRISGLLPDRSSKIVDIGCANGGLLNELFALGYNDLSGIDPSPACIENTKKIGYIKGFVGTFSNLPQNIGEFNLIILSHVLEHVQDIQRAVVEIGSLLSSEGLVYVEVPDANRFSDFNYSPFQEFNTEHINYFSIHGLISLFSKVDLTPTSQDASVIRIGDNIDYPVISVVFTRGQSKFLYSPDLLLRKNICKYISNSNIFFYTLDGRLRTILSEYSEIIVWGTGQLAMKLLAYTCLGNAHIVSFVDGNPVNQGKAILDIPVISPRDLKKLSPYPIIVTTLLHQNSIMIEIEKLGLQNKVITLG